MEMNSAIPEAPNKKKTKKNPLNKNSSCNWKNSIERKIPIIKWLPKYNTNYLLHDLLAGFTVALTEIPQSIAYAGIAGLPLQYGLYSSFMGGFVYAIFGSCRAINMGSTSIMALLIQSHVTTMGLGASVFMSLIGGIIILLLGLINLGFVFEFFSYPVMAGFTSAAAFTIASSQIKNFLGIAGQATGFLQSWQSVVGEAHKISKWDTILGVVSLSILFFLKEIGGCGNVKDDPTSPKTCSILRRSLFFLSVVKNSVIVALGMLLAYILERNNLNYLKLTGCVTGGFPHFAIPTIDNFIEMVEEFGVSMIFIPMVAILETIAIAKVFSKGKSLDGSQEMVALGVANIMGSLVLSMPVTGSFTRTAVNNASGAKTNMAAVFTGVSILVALPFLTSTFYYIPKATLAAVIICAMFYLFDFEAFALFWKTSKPDLIPMLATLLSSLFLSLEYGILIGISTNLLFVLHAAARPPLKLEKLKSNCQDEVYSIAPNGTIMFPAAEFLRNVILQCQEEGALIIFDGQRVDRMDATVAKSIAVLVAEIEEKRQRIVLVNFQRSIEEMCLCVDKKLVGRFAVGELKDVLSQGRPSMEAVPRLSEIYTVL